MQPEPHPDLEHLLPLIGTWRGRGAGSYPTIEPFEYTEEITFGHVGKPFLAYSQKTRHAETGLPLHGEAGFLRPSPDMGVELALAQPSGIVEVDEGTVEIDETGALTIDLSSRTVAGTTTAKDVQSVRRVITLRGPEFDQLDYIVEMGAVGQPHQHHLAATLHRVAEDPT